MPTLVPFRGYRARPSYAAQVSAVAFESIGRHRELQQPEDFPFSYLRTVRPDLFDERLQGKPDALHKAARNHFQHLLDRGIVEQDAHAALYIYRQVDHHSAYTGILGLASVEDYRHNLIKKHEETQVAKEQAIVDYFKAVGVNGSPVLLAYDDDGRLEAELRRTLQQPPVYDFVTPLDGKRHQLWVRDDQEFLDLARDSMGASPAFYIADGHHRCAAAARWAEVDDVPGSCWFMAFWISTSQMNIHSFNRLVRDVPGLKTENFVDRLKDEGVLVRQIDPPHQSILGRQEMLMWIDEFWFHVSLPRHWIDANDKASQLEVTQLQQHILGPMLGITDSRTDARIQYAYGSGDPSQVAVKAREESIQIIFFPPAIAVHQLIQIANAGARMPPKSTWVEPKLRSGLVIHALW